MWQPEPPKSDLSEAHARDALPHRTTQLGRRFRGLRGRTHPVPAFVFPPAQCQRRSAEPHRGGGGTHSVAGVPVVLCSARVLDEVVPHAAYA